MVIFSTKGRNDAPISQIVESGYIYDTLLYKFCPSGQPPSGEECRSSHRSDGVKQTVLNQALFQAIPITFPATGVASANRRPGESHSGAAA